jgi:ribosomal-protein-alanine N-acetyltransferase
MSGQEPGAPTRAPTDSHTVAATDAPVRLAAGAVCITVDVEPSADDRRVVAEGLRAYNAATVGDAKWTELGVFARDAAGRALGGLLGVLAWEWLHVHNLWLPAELRGVGLGAELMRRAEAYALERGYRGVALDTFDFQALPFYQKLGYEVFGTLEGYPAGHRQLFLRKDLGATGGADAARSDVELRLELGSCVVRDLRVDDAASLARHANNRKIWLNVRDRFPHPYTEADARRFIAAVTALSPRRNFAIEVDGAAIGGIGLRLQEDVERVSAELGYWVGEPYWGRGIATAAVQAMTAYGFERYGLSRIYAVVFDWNPASARVLEKAGYSLEGRMRRSAIKDGTVVDQLLYSFVRE